jgi:hypothetical protein
VEVWGEFFLGIKCGGNWGQSGAGVIIIGAALHFWVVCQAPPLPSPGLGSKCDDENARATAFRHHGGWKGGLALTDFGSIVEEEMMTIAVVVPPTTTTTANITIDRLAK